MAERLFSEETKKEKLMQQRKAELKVKLNINKEIKSIFCSKKEEFV
jgi:hypothetical protein